MSGHPVLRKVGEVGMSEDLKNSLDWLNEIVTNPDGWRMFYSDSETKSCAEAAVELLKEQEAEGKWIYGEDET